MNLLYPQINNKPTGLLNTQPISLLNNYSNFFTPRDAASPAIEAPIIHMPYDRWYEGDATGIDGDPNNGAGEVPDFSGMSNPDLDAYSSMMDDQADLMAVTPAFGKGIKAFASFLSNQAQNDKSTPETHAPGSAAAKSYSDQYSHGTPTSNDAPNTDPSSVGGVEGSAGNAASTGGGGHGPDQGGDGGFGLAGGGYVGYAVDGNPNPEQPDGTPRDNVMLPMNTKEGVLPPDVMEYIGVDGLNDFINSIRQQAGQANQAQDKRSMLLG